MQWDGALVALPKSATAMFTTLQPWPLRASLKVSSRTSLKICIFCWRFLLPVCLWVDFSFSLCFKLTSACLSYVNQPEAAEGSSHKSAVFFFFFFAKRNAFQIDFTHLPTSSIRKFYRTFSENDSQCVDLWGNFLENTFNEFVWKMRHDVFSAQCQSFIRLTLPPLKITYSKPARRPTNESQHAISQLHVQKRPSALRSFEAAPKIFTG